jgi:hypothetical protein
VVERRVATGTGTAGEAGGVDEQNVLPAVIVVVEEGHARAHRLREIPFAEGTVDVREMEARGGRDVDELHGGARL